MTESDFDALYAAYGKRSALLEPAFRGRWEGPDGVRELVAMGTRLAERGPGATEHSLERPDRLALKLELYRRIIRLRERGNRLADGLDPSELPEFPVRNLREDEEYNFLAEDRGLKTLLRIDDDLRVAGDLDLRSLYEQADVLVVNGDLIVDGAIHNLESDYGPVVYVHGETVADALLVGGATLELRSAYLHLGSVNWYNHGSLYAQTGGDAFAIDLEDDSLRYNGAILYDFTARAAALFHPREELFDLSGVDLQAARSRETALLDDPAWIEAQLDTASDDWVDARLNEEAFLALFEAEASRLCLLEAFATVWPHARKSAL